LSAVAPGWLRRWVPPGRISWPALLATVAGAVALAALNYVLILLLGDKLHLAGANPGGQTLGAVASGAGLVRLGATVVTQLWYLLVVTFGLAGVGWVAAVRTLRPRPEPRTDPRPEPRTDPAGGPDPDSARQWTFVVALVATVGVAVGAAVILAGVTNKPSDAIYARYITMLAPFWLTVGVAALWTAPARRAVRLAAASLGLLVVGGAVVAGRLWYVAEHGHSLRYGGFGAPDLMVLTGGWREFRPVTGTLIAVGAAVVLAAASRHRRLRGAIFPLLVAVNLLVMGAVVSRVLEPKVALARPTPVLRELGVGPGDTVASTFGYDYVLRLNLAHEVHWTDVRTFQEVPPPDAAVVLARWFPGGPKDWPGERYGYHRVGGNVAQHWAVWRRG
jgi:hypothetical protein